MKSIQIKSNGREQLTPYCSPQVYEELVSNFNLNYLMGHNSRNNDEHIGYIKGVMDVLARVKVLSNYNNEDEE